MIDFEEATDDNIETLDETSNNSEEIKGTIFDNDSTQNQDTEGTVIDVNRLFDVHEKEEQIAEEEETSLDEIEPDSDSAEALRIVKHERYDNTKGRLEYE